MGGVSAFITLSKEDDMERSEAFDAFVGRYHDHLGDAHLDARYRPEFLDAMQDRARGLAAGRRGQMALADDYDPGTRSHDVLSETGGCEWTCPEHGSSSPNRPRCHCPVPGDGNPWESWREARMATATWVAWWETANGSRFLPEEAVMASLRREVWLARRRRRQGRAEDRRWFRKFRRQTDRLFREG